MAASRSSSLRILRAVLPDTQPNIPTKRALHITGSRNSPAFSPTGAKETTATFQRRSLTDLKEECYKRTISSSGTKHELVERLANHDALQSRAFSIAMKRIVKEERGPLGGRSFVERTPTRHFNTSRSHKANNDSSTMDFAYLPDMSTPLESSAQAIRVPLAPDAFDIPSPSPQAVIHSSSNPVDASLPVMKAEIYTVSNPDGDNVEQTIVSSMQEVVDNHAVDLDPYNLTETVTRAAKSIGDKIDVDAEGSASGLKRVWTGFVDDLLGEKKKHAS